MTDFGKMVIRETGRDRRRRPPPPKPFDYLDESTWPEDEEAFKDALWQWMQADPPKPP